MKREDYGITVGEVFQLKEKGEQFVVCDLITHTIDVNGKDARLLQDPDLVFRSVSNINTWQPSHELITIPLSIYKSIAIIKPLTARI